MIKYDIRDSDDTGIFISFETFAEANNWLNKMKKENPERVIKDGMHVFKHEFYTELEQYEHTGLTPAKVAELAQAKKDGLLVVLPCELGTKVYEAICKRDNRDCHYVLDYTFSWNTYTAVTEALSKGKLFYTRKEAENYTRKQGFLTKAEAQVALDRMEGQE